MLDTLYAVRSIKLEYAEGVVPTTGAVRPIAISTPSTSGISATIENKESVDMIAATLSVNSQQLKQHIGESVKEEEVKPKVEPVENPKDEDTDEAKPKADFVSCDLQFSLAKGLPSCLCHALLLPDTPKKIVKLLTVRATLELFRPDDCLSGISLTFEFFS